jgi:hypothetical protein
MKTIDSQPIFLRRISSASLLQFINANMALLGIDETPSGYSALFYSAIDSFKY